MNREEQMAQVEGSRSEEIGGRKTVGGYLSKTNYPGHTVPGSVAKEAREMADVLKKSLAEQKQKKMFEPWADGRAYQDDHAHLGARCQDHNGG